MFVNPEISALASNIQICFRLPAASHRSRNHQGCDIPTSSVDALDCTKFQSICKLLRVLLRA